MAAGAGRAAILAVALLAASATVASALLTVGSSSLLQVGVRAPPATLEEGAGASKARHFERFEISANGTSFSATLRARAGGDVVVKDVVRVVSGAGGERTVTLRADPVPNANVEAFTWTVRNGSASVAVLDHKAASPSATFTLPAGAAYRLDVRVDLADGAGNDNAAPSFGVRMEVR